jgi:hypothetical protein
VFVVPKIYAYHGKLARCSLPSLQFFVLEYGLPVVICRCWEVKLRSAVKPVTLFLVNTIKYQMSTGSNLMHLSGMC